MLTTQTSSTPSSLLEGAGQIAVRAVLEQVRVAEQFIAVVGPPAAGKSTVTRALADRFGARVVRLREFAHESRLVGSHVRLPADHQPRPTRRTRGQQVHRIGPRIDHLLHLADHL